MLALQLDLACEYDFCCVSKYFSLPWIQYAFANGSFEEASFSGGGNITFGGTLEGDAFFTTRLFLGELALGDVPVHFAYSVSRLICK